MKKETKTPKPKKNLEELSEALKKNLRRRKAIGEEKQEKKDKNND
ncbi:MAG: hypothetical protein RLZZ59_358 [Pseudomonadota bacterium]|jgi:hypothetical protein